MDGKDYTEEDTIKIYKDAVIEFKKHNPSFIGAKLIYTAPKHLEDRIEHFFNVCIRLHKDHPDFVPIFQY